MTRYGVCGQPCGAVLAELQLPAPMRGEKEEKYLDVDEPGATAPSSISAVSVRDARSSSRLTTTMLAQVRSTRRTHGEWISPSSCVSLEI
jgi:hypothetical protein